MSEGTASRFAPQNKNTTTNDRLSTNTVGLVALSDYRKRRAEVLEQQEREAREALSGISTPDRSPNATPTPDPTAGDSNGRSKQSSKKKKKARLGGTKLSFGDEDGDEDEQRNDEAPKNDKHPGGDAQWTKTAKLVANESMSIVPKVLTKTALRREATEREALRREFLALQEAVKATEIALPFVFYDGTNIPGGIVRAKKGDHVWLFLDKSRKVGAELGVGEKANARREWARVGVDDLMLVRGSVIIPHHYDFYFFIINKCIGPGGNRIFGFSGEATPKHDKSEVSEPPSDGLLLPASRTRDSDTSIDVSALEGATDDPTLTKVVDRRWYERNKHIYPANVWQEFDADKNYEKEVRRDAGGNAFFFSK